MAAPIIIDNRALQHTNTSLVAAPGAGFRIHVYGFQLSSDSTINVTFENTEGGNDPIFYTVSNATTGVGPRDSTVRPLWEVQENAALTVSSSGAANLTIIIQYEIVGA